MFSSCSKIRSLQDWFIPLDGCSCCGYPYVPEPGYYTVVTGVASLGIGSLMGWLVFLNLKLFWGWGGSNFWILPFVVLSILISAVLFTRHAKAFYLMGDFLFHAHEEGGEDDGDLRLTPPPKAPSGSTTSCGPTHPEKSPKKQDRILSDGVR